MALNGLAPGAAHRPMISFSVFSLVIMLPIVTIPAPYRPASRGPVSPVAISANHVIVVSLRLGSRPLEHFRRYPGCISCHLDVPRSVRPRRRRDAFQRRYPLARHQLGTSRARMISTQENSSKSSGARPRIALNAPPRRCIVAVTPDGRAGNLFWRAIRSHGIPLDPHGAPGVRFRALIKLSLLLDILCFPGHIPLWTELCAGKGRTAARTGTRPTTTGRKPASTPPC